MSPDHRFSEETARRLESEWQLLCRAHLPVRPKRSLWWYNRGKNRSDLPQGWKVHVSATILSAGTIFRLVAPSLQRQNVLFKAPNSLRELHKLNSGLFYGFSQVGKFITVYPPSTDDAVALALALDRLTARMPAPLIPYDEALLEGSCVHYRYGQFYGDLGAMARKKFAPVIMKPDGKMVPDRREPGAAVPGWLADPFRLLALPSARTTMTALETDYSAYEAIVQRGRGGVYRARDHSVAPPRLCIIKEGRKHGETDWLGRDGIDRIRREANFLRTVSPGVRGMPRIIKTFRANDCYYLVMEHIAGRTLQSVITSRERISVGRMVRYCLGMARILADIHAAGWAWLDCKPQNFLCRGNHELCAIDFEGACRRDEPGRRWMETPGYVPNQRDRSDPQADDLFALGASFAQLVGRKAFPPGPSDLRSLQRCCRRLPEPFAEITLRLMHPDREQRPAARAVQTALDRTRRSL